MNIIVRIIKVIHALKKKKKTKQNKNKMFNTHQREDTKECIGEIESMSCNIDYTYNTTPCIICFLSDKYIYR